MSSAAANVDFRGITYLAGLILGAVVIYKLVKAAPSMDDAAAAAKKAVSAIDPTNPDNIVNSGVNKIVETVTGETGVTLGTKIFDWLHPNQPDPNAATPLPGNSKASASQANVLGQFQADRDDADEGAMIRAAQLGTQFIGAIDQEDADLGAAIRAGSVTRSALTPAFSFLTRTGKNF